MYMTCTISSLLCYTAWTISMERAQTAKKHGHKNQSANISTVVWMFIYSPCYNIGFNALTYSTFPLIHTILLIAN
jgi:hypothetical protein